MKKSTDNASSINLKALSEPLRPEDLEWRIQSQTKDGKKAVVVPYLTNRVVMTRFDEAFGVLGWQSSFQEIADGFLCTLSVRHDDGTWISKTDGAPRTDIEKIKGGVSGAMKRCAVQFGLGRTLYDFPRIFIETGDKFIPAWAMTQLDKLTDAWGNGWRTQKDMVYITNGGRNEWDSFKPTKPLPERVSEPEEAPAPATAAAAVPPKEQEMEYVSAGVGFPKAMEEGSFEHISSLVDHACTVARFNEILRLMVDSQTLTIEQKRKLGGRLKELGDTWFIKYNPTTACYLNSKGDYKVPEFTNAEAVIMEFQQKIDAVKTPLDAEACFAVINFENELFPLLIQDLFATCTMNGIGAEANGTDVKFYKL